MANPFYRNRWNPISHGFYPQAQIQPQAAKPKIINIPVHFVSSDDATSKQSMSPATADAAASAVPTWEARIAAAVTIQRVVRGFLVRKNARLVRQVVGEVEVIERKVKEEEAKIRLDARERFLLSETLMSLLLRLDSVRGVRDLRKRVIRRVMSLQEVIDSISAAANGPIYTIDKTENQEGLRDEASEDSSIDQEKTTDETSNLDEEMNEDETELGIKFPAAVESRESNIDQIATVDVTIPTSGVAEDLEVSRIKVTEEASLEQEKGANKTLDLEEETDEDNTELEMKIPAAVESSERQCDLTAAPVGTISSLGVAEDREGSVEVAAESSIDHEKAADQTLDLEEETKEAEAEAELDVEIRAAVESPKRNCNLMGINVIGEDGSRSPDVEEENLKAEEGASMLMDSAKREEGSGMWEMVERMALENEKLKGMVAQLCATSSEQCRLMKSLVDRLEQLERVVHHRMDRRRKRRSSSACSAFSSAK